ncbi:hypothetical protein [Streptomyces sp. NPDC051014]|uniref:hypothetical protein n=1 Tax=Streptomyces sp. NPDC051014 TaxID=3155751 RepID=UPI0033F207C8
MSVLDELLVRLGIDSEGLSVGAEEAANDVESKLSGIATGAAGVAVAGLFVAGFESAMDISGAETKLQNQLNLTDTQAGEAGQIAGDVFSQGFGESIDEVSEALGGVAQNLGGFANVGQKELTELTREAEALSDTFEFDVAESTQAAGQLLKAGLAKDGEEAFDLITRAAQQLPPAMREELPDVTKEYSTFFSQIGATGPQMFGLLTEAAKSPLFELDKLADAVKEFTLQISNTSAVEQPLKQLGLDVGHIQGLVNKGQGTKAFDEVNDALAKVQDQTKRTTIQAALFGGPGEDVANTLQAVANAGGFASADLGDVAGAAKDVADNMAASPAQAWDSIMRTLTTTIGEALAPALAVLANFLKDNPGLVQAVTPVVLALAVALGIWAVAQWAVNSALLANPVTWIILGIVALVAIIVMIATKTTWFQDIWHAMTQGVVGAWNWLWNGVRSIVSTQLSWVLAFIRLNVSVALTIFGWFAALPGRVGGWFASVYNAAVSKLSSLVSWVRGLPARILSAVGSLNNLLYNAGRSVIQGLLNGIMSMLGSLRSHLGSVTSMIPDWKGPMDVDLQLLTPSGHAVMQGFMDGIDDQVPALEKQLTGVTSGIPTNVQTGVSTAAATATGGGQITVTLDGSGGDPFMDWLKERIRVEYGGDVANLNGGA